MAGRITVECVGADVIRLTIVADVRIAGASGEPARRTSWAADAGSLDTVGGGEPSADGHRLFTVDQVAEILGISRDLVYDLLRRGQIRSTKIGRLRRISGQWLTSSSSGRPQPALCQADATACCRYRVPVSPG
ncbi:MAG TPA: helix-turn-helix domain-containing protein [Streptosporangiaceae bacterium]|jgi:excisionase family DNA binding protein|nr:helix-turn-helix domain-containing protein [Streptosporangiaceae bacterium]